MEKSFVALCYHYVKPERNPFPRILGIGINEFQKQLEMLKEKYSIISPKDVLEIYHDSGNLKEQKNILLTFDDGLSDHYEVAKILNKFSIKAIFFIPTCIINKKLPANPMIIHYCIAEFGIKKFLNVYHEILKEELKEKHTDFVIENKTNNKVWDTINEIKNTFKYKLEFQLSRKILLKIYKKIFLPIHPNGLEMIHLNENQIKNMIKMGHTIGTHTDTHISVSATKLNQSEFEREIILPKEILDKKFGLNIFAFSYPFGEEKDCLSSSELIKKTKKYQIAFTVKEEKNTKNTSSLQLGRISPQSTDNSEKLFRSIEMIFEKNI
jgi:peptidoglycan/xylan/chitin deacetylase (PgdA/CDA1 family)